MGETVEIGIVDQGGAHEMPTVELLHGEGYLERMGVRVRRTWVTNGADAADLLLKGQADAAIQIGFGPALKAIAGGAPLRVIAAANLLPVHAIYSKKPEIRRLADLAGRTVGVGPPGALTHQLIHAALLKHGVDPAEARFVTIGSSAAIFRALQADKIDAGFGETEVFENQARYGVHALQDALLWRELPEFPNQASYATLAAIGDKREALVRVLAAHALLYRRLQDPTSWEAYAAASAKGLPGADPEEARVQWRFYRDYRPYAEDLDLSPERVAYLQALNVRMGLQDHVLPFEAVADLSLAREAVSRIEGGA